MILVLGGTSDSIRICNILNEIDKEYIISVTTQYGANLVEDIAKNIVINKMNIDDMIEFINSNNIKLVIDATHPYAVEVSKNAVKTTEILEIHYIRYERKSLLEEINYDNVIKVNSTKEAYTLANEKGRNIFLGTGSKTIKEYVDNLTDKKVVARVLPTLEVIKQCEEMGLNADNIIAMKGPFSEAINEEIYKHYNIDLIITKESGKEGGFLEKINAARNLNIPVIVIVRDRVNYPKVINEINKIKEFLVGDR
ncbi:MAG: cobalt-precorrin-6A reductase [Paraclostridium sp.]